MMFFMPAASAVAHASGLNSFQKLALPSSSTSSVMMTYAERMRTSNQTAHEHAPHCELMVWPPPRGKHIIGLSGSRVLYENYNHTSGPQPQRSEQTSVEVTCNHGPSDSMAGHLVGGEHALRCVVQRLRVFRSALARDDHLPNISDSVLNVITCD